MNQPCYFSTPAEEYLQTYQEILHTMIQGMENAALTNSISNNFITQMIPHHMAAIDMSENILRYTKNRDLQRIAQNIISEQTASIKNMRAVHTGCAALENTCSEVSQYQNCVSRIIYTMFSGMKNAYADDNISCDFLREMIPHHEGAVRMSENALRFPICPELFPILEAIISSQKKGIVQMQSLLRSLCTVS